MLNTRRKKIHILFSFMTMTIALHTPQLSEASETDQQMLTKGKITIIGKNSVTLGDANFYFKKGLESEKKRFKPGDEVFLLLNNKNEVIKLLSLQEGALIP